MNTRLNKLIELNARTNDLVEFKKLYDPATGEWVDDGTGSNAGARLTVGAGVLGVGGYAGQKAITRAGGYGAVARRAGTGLATATGNLGERISTAGAPKIGNVVAGLPRNILKLLKKVRFESREARIIHLSAEADKLLEFKTPWAEFKETETSVQQRENKKLKAAKRIYKEAKSEHFVNTLMSPEIRRAHQKLADESYGGRGAAVGAVTGATGGAVLGRGIEKAVDNRLRSHLPKKARAHYKGGRFGTLAALGGIEGLILGGSAGMNIGHRIRRQEK